MTLVALGALAFNETGAFCQTGFVSSVNNVVHVSRAGGAEAPLAIGDYIEELPVTITCGASSQAMLFFVGGLGGEGAEFRGAIVVLIGENSRLMVARGVGAARPIEFTLEQGCIKVHFDPGPHREHVLVSVGTQPTPVATMRVTGSILWAIHEPQSADYLLASEDSDALVTHNASHATQQLLSGQKLVATAAGLQAAQPLTPDDQRRCTMPNLSLISALSQRLESRVRAVTGVYARLETGTAGAVTEVVAVVRPVEANVPTQEPTPQMSTLRSVLALSAQNTQAGAGGPGFVSPFGAFAGASRAFSPELVRVRTR
jgi:hypothetical protein